MALRNYTAKPTLTNITTALNGTDAPGTSTTVGLASTANLPAAPFTAGLDLRQGAEEVVLVTALAGGTATITRGYNGTSVSAHASGTGTFEHVTSAIDFTEVNAHINAASGAHAASAVSVNPTGLVVVTASDVQAAFGQLDARAASVPTFDTTGIVDGQLMQWNATLGKFIPVNKTGSAELAYAANTTGTTTAVTNTQNIDIPGVTFTVQPDPRAVYIQAGLAFQQTTTGDGSVILHITDTTSAVDVGAPSVRLPNTVTAGIKTGYIMTAPFRLGPIATARTFKISLQVSGSGATPAVIALNTAANPSWLTASA